MPDFKVLPTVNGVAVALSNAVVNLTTTQTVGGDKTFTDSINIGGEIFPIGAFSIAGSAVFSRPTISAYATGTQGPLLTLRHSRHATVGSHTSLQSGDELGSISFKGSDGTSFIYGATILAKVDGTPGTSDMPTRLEFYTAPDGTGNQVLALTIDNQQRIGIGGSPSHLVDISQTGSTGYALRVIRNLTSASTDSPVVFILQDHTGDDQAAFVVEQDGTGDIVQFLDGATKVFVILDGGYVGFSQATPTSVIHITQTQTTGKALYVERNLTSSSTDSPLVSFVQDHASDDQPVLYIQQDGTGDIIQAFDGATKVFTVLDGGNVLINTGTLCVGLASMGATVLGGKAGSSTNDFAAGGVLYKTTTVTGNVGTGQDTIASYVGNIPASTLGTNGQSLCFRAWGTTANNANVKTLRVNLASNNLFSRTMTPSVANNWFLQGEIMRTGANAQECYAMCVDGSVTEIDRAGLTVTNSNANSFTITGEATSDNDIVCRGFTLWWEDVNT